MEMFPLPKAQVHYIVINNKVQVAQIPIQEHKHVPAKCSLENAPSKTVQHVID